MKDHIERLKDIPGTCNEDNGNSELYERVPDLSQKVRSICNLNLMKIGSVYDIKELHIPVMCPIAPESMISCHTSGSAAVSHLN